MLNAAELRIGNYLWFNEDMEKKEIKAVTATDIVDIEFNNADGYAPVLLTAELLKRASFQPNSSTDLEFILDADNKLVATPFIGGGVCSTAMLPDQLVGSETKIFSPITKFIFCVGRKRIIG